MRIFYRTMCLIFGVFALGFIAGLILPLQLVVILESLFLIILVGFVFFCW